MTLSELATQVGTVTGMIETDDIAAAKSFLTAKHRLMWNHQLWKDSLVEYNATLSPDDYAPDSVWLPDAGVLLLPASIQKVIAVRSSDYHLNARRQEFFYRMDYNAFAATGTPYEFFVLPPVVWHTDQAAQLALTLSSAADIGQTITLDMLKADGVTYLRYPIATTALTTYFNLDSSAYTLRIPPCYTSQIGAIIKPATNGTVTLKICDYPLSYIVNNVSGTIPVTVTAEDLTVETVQVTYGTPYQVPYRINSITTGGVGTGVSPARSGTWTFYGSGWMTDTLDISILTMLAADVSAAKRQRIRLVRIPSAETVVRVLGKRDAPSFSNDSDVPGINGSEDYLIAFASAQMWERARQFGKKQVLLQEADALLGDLIRQETVQQAHHLSITPETGMGNEYNSALRWFGKWP